MCYDVDMYAFDLPIGIFLGINTYYTLLFFSSIWAVAALIYLLKKQPTKIYKLSRFFVLTMTSLGLCALATWLIITMGSPDKHATELGSMMIYYLLILPAICINSYFHTNNSSTRTRIYIGIAFILSLVGILFLGHLALMS